VTVLGSPFGAHSYKPHLLGGMLVAVGGRAKELLFGTNPSRTKLKKTSGVAITSFAARLSLLLPIDTKRFEQPRASNLDRHLFIAIAITTHS
jgi:hypothetical protein